MGIIDSFPQPKEGNMKKFLFLLLLLIILGGVAFFFGWAHLSVPPGSYGVIRSKTHGLDSQIIRDGEFRWIWYKLIPTNVKISVYTLNPVKRSIRSTGTLPSGQIYASLAGLEADFSWEVSGDLSFILKPEMLPVFTARENLNDNSDLLNAEDSLANRIETMVLQKLKSYADEEDGKKMETISITGSLKELDNEIEASFPEIENFACSIHVARYPDYDLYQSVKDLYREYIKNQSANLKPEISRGAEKRLDMNLRMDELVKYGELLSKYPILLQYLSLERGVYIPETPQQ